MFYHQLNQPGGILQGIGLKNRFFTTRAARYATAKRTSCRIYRTILYSCLGFFFALPVFAQPMEAPVHLAAFSLPAAREALAAGTADPVEVHELGFISRIWAVLLDEQGGIVIVGERDPSVPSILLDDVVVALRTRNRVSLGSGEDQENQNPGVSIEPIDQERYAPVQKVVYYGLEGLTKTHYARICLQADLLLKHISNASLPSIPGLPSEFELLVDNEKAGRLLYPGERNIGRSFFFPLKVSMNRQDDLVVVTSTKMIVRSEFDNEFDFSNRRLSLEADALTAILDARPHAVSALFARLYSQHIDQIASRYPVLVQLENLLVLSGLMNVLLKESHPNDLNYWLKEYDITPVNTPETVPTFSKGVNGLGYNVLLSGGVRGEYDLTDAWRSAVLSRRPRYLKQAALRARPSDSAVSWAIPLHQGLPSTWTDSLLQDFDQRERQRLAETPRAAEEEHLFLQLEDSETIVSSGWKPRTRGKNLIAFEGKLVASSGGRELYSPDKRFSLSGADFTGGVTLNLRWVYNNWAMLEATFPFVTKVEVDDRPHPTLPGLQDISIGLAAGLESPSLSSRILILNGLKEGRWRRPILIVENALTLPVSHQAFNTTFGLGTDARDFQMSFGTEQWGTTHSLQTIIPAREGLRLVGQTQYYKAWGRDEAGADNLVWSLSTDWQLDTETGFGIGLQTYVRYFRQAGKEGFWTKEGQAYLMSISIPGRVGMNSLQFGYFVPSQDLRNRSGGAFLLSLDLSGVRLWNQRTWY